jgi:putative endonuclease
MIANKPNGTIYKGMTSDIVQRVWQHKVGSIDGFTKKYDVKLLVWYQECASVEQAVKMEKRLRKYPRQWKINLIEQGNPEWLDLYADLIA